MNVCAAAQQVLCSKLIVIIRNESKLFHSIFKVYKTKRSQKGKSYCWRLLSNLTWLKHPARAAAFQTFEFLFGATHPCRHLAVCAVCGWLPAYSFFLIFKVHLLLCVSVWAWACMDTGQGVCGGQRTPCGSQVLPPTMWACIINLLWVLVLCSFIH